VQIVRATRTDSLIEDRKFCEAVPEWNRAVLSAHGHVGVAAAVTTFLNGADPLDGAFGSDGANTVIGKYGPEPVHWKTKGCVVS
jgi:hypothetical protein